MRNISEL